MSTLEARRIVGEMILYLEYFGRYSTVIEGAAEEDCDQLIKDARELWDVLTCTREREL